MATAMQRTFQVILEICMFHDLLDVGVNKVRTTNLLKASHRAELVSSPTRWHPHPLTQCRKRTHYFHKIIPTPSFNARQVQCGEVPRSFFIAAPIASSS